MSDKKEYSRTTVHFGFWVAYITLFVTIGPFFTLWSALGEYIDKTIETGKLNFIKGIKYGFIELFDYPRRVHNRCINHYHSELEKCGNHSEK